MSKPALEIVIVDYSAGPLIRDCLESIAAYQPHEAALGRVVVVDNASSDATSQYTDGLDIPLCLIRNVENRGFAAACNQGAADSAADYLLFLNPDTRLKANSLDAPTLFLEDPANRSVGIVGIQLLHEDGRIARTCSYQPRLIHFVNKALALDRLSPTRFPTGFMKDWDHTSSREVDVVMGAFYFVRRSVFNQLHGFDERFFIYFEEGEFALRARQAGYRTYYLAEAQAYHRGQGSSEKIKARRLYYSLQSRLRYGYKHFDRMSAWILLLVTVMVEPLSRIVLSVIQRSGTEFRETVSAYRMLWRSLPRTLRIRS